MVRLLAILSVVASMLTSSVLANPTFPGTCVVNGMRAPHGTTAATDATYTVSVKQTAKAATGNTYTVTIGGTGTFTGLLFYATDVATKARFGSFTKIAKDYAPLTSCKGENPKTNTLGHNSVLEKSLPATFTWTDANHNAGKAWKGSFTGIVMSSTSSIWYVIPPTAVKGGSGASNVTVPTPSSVPSVSVSVSTPGSVSTIDSSSPSSPSGLDNLTNPSNTSNTETGATQATGASSSAARLDGSFVLCFLLSAFVLIVRL